MTADIEAANRWRERMEEARLAGRGGLGVYCCERCASPVLSACECPPSTVEDILSAHGLPVAWAAYCHRRPHEDANGTEAG